MSIVRRSLCAAALWAVLSPPLARAAEPLSVAAPGFNTAFVLEKFAARSAFLASQASGDSSLVASKAARELQLMVANARVELRDLAEDHWDKIAAPRQAILRELDRAIAAVPAPGGPRGRIEDAVVLDVGPALSRLQFAPTTPVIRRVEGATQYFHAEGNYRLAITTNLPAIGASGYAVSVAGQPAPAAWLKVTPPDRVVLDIPVRALSTLFSDQALVHLPVELTAVVPSTTWKFWTPRTAQASYLFSLELFPKKPLSYELKETAAPTAVDASQTLLAKGKPQTVPGCGSRGCVRDQNICYDVPKGAKPLETINYQDSSGSVEGGWTGAVVATPTGFCAIYKQQSAQRARDVSFDIRYNPVSDEPAVTERKLRPVRKDPSSDPPPDADALEIGTVYTGDLSDNPTGWTLRLKAFTGQTFTARAGAAPSSKMLRVGPLEKAGDASRLRVSFQLPW